MFKRRVLNILGYIPLLTKWVFKDADAIVTHLTNIGTVDYISELPPTERRMLYFTLGTDIRNNYLLWHPKNPYTMVPLQSISREQQVNSGLHPDNYSWAIIRRLVVASGLTVSPNSNDLETSENVIYSLISKADNSPEVLENLRVAIAQLVENYRWDLLDEVFLEALNHGASPAKMQVLIDTTSDNTANITPVNYLRVVKLLISDEFQEKLSS